MTKLNSVFRLLMVLSMTIFLIACSSNELEVTAQFSNTQDIDEGDVVYFENQPIGEVADSKSQGNGLSIVIELAPSAAELVSSNSAIVVNRLKQTATLEIYNSNNVTSEFVQNGQQIKGLDSMFQLGAWMVGDAIQLGSSSLSEYVGAFQEYLQSDKFLQDKSLVQEQVKVATSEAQQAIESLGTELTSTMQELTATKGEAAQAIEQFGNELSPVVQELAKSGSVLMEQLEIFTESLEQIDVTKQEAGQTFLEGLTVMLETLNKSVEAGLEEGEVNDSTERSQ